MRKNLVIWGGFELWRIFGYGRGNKSAKALMTKEEEEKEPHHHQQKASLLDLAVPAFGCAQKTTTTAQHPLVASDALWRLSVASTAGKGTSTFGLRLAVVVESA